MWARLLVRIDHTTESPPSNANSNRGSLGAAKKNVMAFINPAALPALRIAGALFLITKPFTPESFKAALDPVLGVALAR